MNKKDRGAGSSPNQEICITETIKLTYPPQEIFQKVCSDNTFSNPKYESNEINGFSNWETDPLIRTYRIVDQSIILPRGYLPELLKLCMSQGIKPRFEDKRQTHPKQFPKLKDIKLRPYQETAVEAAMQADEGVIVSPTGSGKSLVGLEIIRRMGQKALILVHRSDLAEQWVKVIKERMGVNAGLIGSGKWEVGDITVAMIQTLSSREEDTKALNVGTVIFDEVHHAPADQSFAVMGWLAAKYRYGLSATLGRRDGLEMMIYHALGPRISEISKSEVEQLGSTVPITVQSIDTQFNPGYVESWNEYLSALTADSKRNDLIIDLAEQQVSPTLVLVDRVSHADQLSEMMERRNTDHILAHGKLGKKTKAEAMEQIKSAQLTIGTTSLLGEGLDVSSWSCLIMGSPVSSEIKLMQAIGRVVRPAPGKERALVYDLKDDCAFAGNSFKNRMNIYKKHNIWVDFGSVQEKQIGSNDSWRSLPASDKQIEFLKSKGQFVDGLSRGEASDLIARKKYA